MSDSKQEVAVAWVRLGKVWWPGKVLQEGEWTQQMKGEVETLLERKTSVKRDFIHIVKFLNEDEYEISHNPNQILLDLDEDKKADIIKRALSSMKTPSLAENKEKFKKDVLDAERLLKPEADLTELTKLLNGESLDKRPVAGAKYADIFPSPKPEKPPPAASTSTTPKGKAGGLKFNFPSSRIVTTASSKSPSKIALLPSDPSKRYRCQKCCFSADRLNVIVTHQKFCNPSPAQLRKAASSPATTVTASSPIPVPPVITPPAKSKVQIAEPVKTSPVTVTPTTSVPSPKRKPGRPPRNSMPAEVSTTKVHSSPEKPKLAPAARASTSNTSPKKRGRRSKKDKMLSDKQKAEILNDWNDSSSEENDSDDELAPLMPPTKPPELFLFGSEKNKKRKAGSTDPVVEEQVPGEKQAPEGVSSTKSGATNDEDQPPVLKKPRTDKELSDAFDSLLKTTQMDQVDKFLKKDLTEKDETDEEMDVDEQNMSDIEEDAHILMKKTDAPGTEFKETEETKPLKNSVEEKEPDVEAKKTVKPEQSSDSPKLTGENKNNAETCNEEEKQAGPENEELVSQIEKGPSSSDENLAIAEKMDTIKAAKEENKTKSNSQVEQTRAKEKVTEQEKPEDALNRGESQPCNADVPVSLIPEEKKEPKKQATPPKQNKPSEKQPTMPEVKATRSSTRGKSTPVIVELPVKKREEAVKSPSSLKKREEAVKSPPPLKKREEAVKSTSPLKKREEAVKSPPPLKKREAVKSPSPLRTTSVSPQKKHVTPEPPKRESPRKAAAVVEAVTKEENKAKEVSKSTRSLETKEVAPVTPKKKEEETNGVLKEPTTSSPLKSNAEKAEVGSPLKTSPAKIDEPSTPTTTVPSPKKVAETSVVAPVKEETRQVTLPPASPLVHNEPEKVEKLPPPPPIFIKENKKKDEPKKKPATSTKKVPTSVESVPLSVHATITKSDDRPTSPAKTAKGATAVSVATLKSKEEPLPPQVAAASSIAKPTLAETLAKLPPPPPVVINKTKYTTQSKTTTVSPSKMASSKKKTVEDNRKVKAPVSSAKSGTSTKSTKTATVAPQKLTVTASVTGNISQTVTPSPVQKKPTAAVRPLVDTKEVSKEVKKDGKTVTTTVAVAPSKASPKDQSQVLATGQTISTQQQQQQQIDDGEGTDKKTPALVAQRVVHLVPVENQDGTITYMLLSLDNASEGDVLQSGAVDGGDAVLRIDKVDHEGGQVVPPMNPNEVEGIFLDKHVENANQIVNALVATQGGTQTTATATSVMDTTTAYVTLAMDAIGENIGIAASTSDAVAPTGIVQPNIILPEGTATVQDESEESQPVFYMTEDGSLLDPQSLGLTLEQLQHLLNQ